MDDFFLETLQQELTTDEDERLHVYDDATGRPIKAGDKVQGHATIGVGRNLESRGISHAVSQMLLREDIDVAVADLNRNLPWWVDLSDRRRLALINMCFNLGWPRLSGFRKMLAALQDARDLEKAGSLDRARASYSRAGDEALDSKWARDVGPARSGRIADYLREG